MNTIHEINSVHSPAQASPAQAKAQPDLAFARGGCDDLNGSFVETSSWTMVSSRIVALTVAIVAILAIACRATVMAASVPAESPELSASPPSLEQSTSTQYSIPLHSVAEAFTGGGFVDVPRRLAGVRQHLRLQQLTDTEAEKPYHAALLKRREDRRDGLAVRSLVARVVSGAASFHTGTPPPEALS